MRVCSSAVPWASLFALVTAVVGCVSFSVLYDSAMEGFSAQVNTLVPVGSFAVRSAVLPLSLLFIVSAVIFVCVGATATSASSRLAVKTDELEEDRSLLIRVATSPCLLGLFSLVSLVFVLLWTLVVCLSAVCLTLYVIFIGGIYSYCALVDNQCYDFTVLLPALIRWVTNKKVELTFCKEKKEALCSPRNNQVWSFIGAFVCSLIALAGLLYFLMCMTANYTRMRSEKRAKKGEHYAMNQGTVDSNSFIMTNMGK